MEEENKKESCCEKIKCSSNSCGGAGGGIYGLAFIGATVYYIQNAETFWMGVLGVLKSLVWPAILVYNLLELLAK